MAGVSGISTRGAETRAVSFRDGDEFWLALLSLVIDHGARWRVLLLEVLVNQFVLSSAIAFNAFSYGVNIFDQRFIASSGIQ